MMNDNILIANRGKTITIEIAYPLGKARRKSWKQQMFGNVIQQFGKIVQRHRPIGIKEIIFINTHCRFQQAPDWFWRIFRQGQ